VKSCIGWRLSKYIETLTRESVGNVTPAQVYAFWLPASAVDAALAGFL
jgi:hypothetical protein